MTVVNITSLVLELPSEDPISLVLRPSMNIGDMNNADPQMASSLRIMKKGIPDLLQLTSRKRGSASATSIVKEYIL